MPSVAGSRNSAAGVSRTTWVAVVAISHLLVPKYLLTTACRGTVSKACSPVASFSHFRSYLNSRHLDERGISSVWARSRPNAGPTDKGYIGSRRIIERVPPGPSEIKISPLLDLDITVWSARTASGGSANADKRRL